MNFLLDPCTKLTDGDSFGFPVFEDGLRGLVIRKAFLQGAALVTRLLCSRLHNSRYVAHVKMRPRILKPPVFKAPSSLSTT